MELKNAICTAAVLVAMFWMTIDRATAQSLDGPAQRLIVKFKEGMQAGSPSAASTRALSVVTARSGVGLRMMHALAGDWNVIRLERRLPQAKLTDVMAALRADPAVASVYEDFLLQPTSAPNDSLYNQQSYYQEVIGMNLPAAWDLSTGAGVRVAVIDTGVRPHPDLAPNLLGGFDFVSDLFMANDGDGRDADPTDPGDSVPASTCPEAPAAAASSWHGTHIAGIIGAVANNGSGIAGVAFGARVVPIRALGRCGANVTDVAQALVWAAGIPVDGVPANPYPARVINMSLAKRAPCIPPAQAAIDAARARGAVIVVAAGNENSDAADFIPANCKGVITVAASDAAGGKARYSNFGAVVDLAAPGGDRSVVVLNGALATFNTGTTGPASDSFGFKEGTSMATANVSGVAALLLSRYNTLTADDVERVLKSTASPFAAPCSGCGAGTVNPVAALAPPVGLQADAGPDRVFLAGTYSIGMIDACGSKGNIASYTFQQLSYRSNSTPGAISSVKRLLVTQSGLTTVEEQSLSAPYVSTQKCRVLVKGFAAGDVLTIRVTVRDAAGNTSSDDVVLRGSAPSSAEYLEAEEELQAIAKAGNFS